MIADEIRLPPDKPMGSAREGGPDSEGDKEITQANAWAWKYWALHNQSNGQVTIGVDLFAQAMDLIATSRR